MYSDYRTTEWLLTQWGHMGEYQRPPRHDFPASSPASALRGRRPGLRDNDADAERADAIISTMAQAHNQQLARDVLQKRPELSGVARR